MIKNQVGAEGEGLRLESEVAVLKLQAENLPEALEELGAVLDDPVGGAGQQFADLGLERLQFQGIFKLELKIRFLSGGVAVERGDLDVGGRGVRVQNIAGFLAGCRSKERLQKMNYGKKNQLCDDIGLD